jgi:hypothetical protein
LGHVPVHQRRRELRAHVPRCGGRPMIACIISFLLHGRWLQGRYACSFV